MKRSIEIAEAVETVETAEPVETIETIETVDKAELVETVETMNAIGSERWLSWLTRLGEARQSASHLGWAAALAEKPDAAMLPSSLASSTLMQTIKTRVLVQS